LINEEKTIMDNDQARYAEHLPPDLLATAQRYAAQPVARPTPEQTRRLVDRLLAEPVIAPASNMPRRRTVLAAMRVARWRVRLMSVPFWIACVLGLAVAGAVTAINITSSRMVPLVMALPLTAVLGLAQASRTPSRGLRDVESAAPVNRTTVMAASALAIVGLDCAFGLIATSFLALLSWAPFAALLVAWLGPLLLLAGLSLPVALRWGAVPAAIVGAGPWLALAVVAFVIPGNSTAAAVFALPHDTLSFALRISAAALGVVVLLLFLRDSSWQRALARVSA
jgi:hypothetical protein